MFTLVGSRYFFSDYPDFVSHDTDYVEILDTDDFEQKRIIRGCGKDIIQLKRKPKFDLIQDALKEGLPMVVGKFLVPEFCTEIGFTIQDLPVIKPLIDQLDAAHAYEEIIYNAYLQNGDFYLTQEQRNQAYTSYKQSRNYS